MSVLPFTARTQEVLSYFVMTENYFADDLHAEAGDLLLVSVGRSKATGSHVCRDHAGDCYLTTDTADAAEVVGCIIKHFREVSVRPVLAVNL